MIRLLPFLLFLLLLSCDDGEIQIEIIDFDSASIEFCESETTVNSTIFFKLNAEESLILTLQNGILKNEPSEGAVSSGVPSQSQLSYRSFSSSISKNYFCDDIPPSAPSVVEEIEGEGGEVLVTTIQSVSDTTAYEHTIELSGISMVNSKGERITNLKIDNFGMIITKEEEEEE